MSTNVILDIDIVDTCRKYYIGVISSQEICRKCIAYQDQLSSLEDNYLRELIGSIPASWNIEWYANFMDEEETEEGYQKIREAILPYVEKIEKIIIRGTTKGGPITEEERTEWWKKQKEREREEFYKFNGYYEDE